MNKLYSTIFIFVLVLTYFVSWHIRSQKVLIDVAKREAPAVAGPQLVQQSALAPKNPERAGLSLPSRLVEKSRVVSPPSLPSSFYGIVMLDGRDAAAGSTVSGWIADTQYAEQPVRMFKGKPFYAINVPADDPSTPDVEGGKPGDVVTFHIGDQVVAETAVWQSGTNVKFDLSATTRR